MSRKITCSRQNPHTQKHVLYGPGFSQFCSVFGSLIVLFFDRTGLDYHHQASFPSAGKTFPLPFVVFKFSNGIHPYHIGALTHMGKLVFHRGRNFRGGGSLHPIDLFFGWEINILTTQKTFPGLIRSNFAKLNSEKSSAETFPAKPTHRQPTNSLVYITSHGSGVFPREGHFSAIRSTGIPKLPT